MEQRVNIQYSIDMEELPEEVDRLLQKANSALKNVCVADLKELSSIDEKSLLSIRSLEIIEQTRKKLAAIDHVLSDVTNIVDGFIKYKTSPPQPETNSDHAPDEDVIPSNPFTSAPATLDELKSQIESFRKDPPAP
jgi:hypothetical protein